MADSDVSSTPPAGAQSACIPIDEAHRLAALTRLELLDTAPTEEFDCITRVAAVALDVPIVLVSLVAEKRQWFKSRVGLDATETPREVSFCAHAVFARKPLIVPDTTLDTRFAGNSLVTGAPYIRAYLGIPFFSTQGYAIGTLCAIDTHVHAFDHKDLSVLSNCAKLVEALIHAQEREKRAIESRRLAAERDRRFRESFELAAAGIIHTDLSGQMRLANKKACRMLGYSLDELQNMSFIDITHSEDIASNMAYVQRLLSGELSEYRLAKRYIRKDRSLLWTELSVALKRTESGVPEYFIAVLEDVASRKEKEDELIAVRDSLRANLDSQSQKLRESNEALQLHAKRALSTELELRDASRRLRRITDHVPAMIAYWNRDWQCEFANAVYRDWYGIDPEKMIGLHLREFLGDEQFTKIEPYATVALEGHAQRFEVAVLRSDGEERMCLARYTPDTDAGGTVRGFFVLMTDVTASRSDQKALREANAKLIVDSSTDFLTGLSNRRVFSEHSKEACRRAQTDDDTYGLILIDLDNFKQINDAYGHAAGDEVLRVTGKLLQGQLRSHRDVAARLGGEEFAVLCFGQLDEDLLRLMAERIREQLMKESISLGTQRFGFTGSFGLAISQATDSDWKNIYSRADAALYAAKAAGKNRVMFGGATLPGVTGKFRALRTVRS